MTELASALDVPLTGERPRFDPAEGRLVGGRCERCGTETWPRRSVCYHCGAASVAEHVLPGEGLLTTWTRVWVPVEGLEPPYSVGLVEFGDLQLFGHVRGVTEDTAIPAEVTVRVDLDEQPPFWFEVPSP